MSFLPGWFPGGAAASNRLTTIVKQAHSTEVADNTITAPADIIAGDLLILMDATAGSYGAPTLVTPSGWTNIVNITTGKGRMAVHRKIADGSEASSNIVTMGGAYDVLFNKILVVYRGNIPATSQTTSTPNTQATTGDPGAQTVSASGGVAPLVVIGCYASDGTVDPRTFTQGGSPAKDGEANGNTSGYQAWKIFNTAPADIVVDMQDEGTNFLASFYVSLS
jgi:hypothetical protein